MTSPLSCCCNRGKLTANEEVQDQERDDAYVRHEVTHPKSPVRFGRALHSGVTEVVTVPDWNAVARPICVRTSDCP